MKIKTKIIIIAIFLIVVAIFLSGNGFLNNTNYKTIADTDIGSVEVNTYGNVHAQKSIALITGIHPRETLAIDPEINAAKEFAGKDVKVIHYKVTVTKDPQDYNLGRANGEKLVHDYVNPNVTASDADAVVISHSHIPEYGEGFYIATPAMDDASVEIAKNINQSSDFNYYPVTGNETYKSTSAVLVSRPIAEAGYPTFVYEVPEDVMEFMITMKTNDLFQLISDNV
ncbi:hypothetical protein [Methanobrevibacter sp.]|uniref:hypothetical protein n=1 Tax=Methanobrevibacter sp. TaxID=66852 RepID=UPI003D7CE8C5